MEHTDYDTAIDPAHRGSHPDEEWEGVWNASNRNHDTVRKIELGLAVLAAAIALVVVRGGWLRMTSRSSHFVPSAADIHVRLPPPR